MTWTRGDQLSPTARAEVLAAWVHRNTVERPFWYSGLSGKPTLTDAEWLASKCFATTRSGRIDRRVKHFLPASILTTEDERCSA